MDQKPDLSVIISTYDRKILLSEALKSALSQQAAGLSYEVIVIDNNSSDGTREVVESFMVRGHGNLRYAFERVQGLSHARNAGIRIARGSIIAFTDDDVRLTPAWAASIKRAFHEHPEVDCVAGKILPKWNSDPPSWLTHEHWTALALQDYGDKPLLIGSENPLCFAGANLSFRREVFDRIGVFSPKYPRAQDTELLMRFWQAGHLGLYEPDAIVVADVQPERLTKSYHRRWHITNGKFNSLMRANEFVGSDGRILTESIEAVRLYDVPAYVYREFIVTGKCWLAALKDRRESLAFSYENQMWLLASYIYNSYKRDASERTSSNAAEMIRFIKNLVVKKAVSSSGKKSARTF
ncbi:MAG TPA: glycosyltransferase [Blastocatellia bacterium]|jgi:glycosyltransferase involved in cell wall biosynthesis|nr:glycosyltransferase [Blastocatellia bacterium]